MSRQEQPDGVALSQRSTPTPADDTAAGADVPPQGVAVRRVGRQRSAVSEQLRAQATFRSAQDVYAALRAEGNPIGLATVYRALQAMVEDGEVDVLRSSEDGEAVYRLCSTGHHHHLVCRSCGTTVEVEGAAVEVWAQAVAAEHGFSAVDHLVEVFGTCGACARASTGGHAG